MEIALLFVIKAVENVSVETNNLKGQVFANDKYTNQHDLKGPMGCRPLVNLNALCKCIYLCIYILVFRVQVIVVLTNTTTQIVLLQEAVVSEFLENLEKMFFSSI